MFRIVVVFLTGCAGALWLGAQHAASSAAFASAASDARTLQLAPGLKLDVWATEPQLSNSVAFGFDGKGRVFLAESDRWAISVFDITAHTNWLLEDMAFRNVADRAAFLTREFATNLSLLTRESEVVRVLEDRDGDGRADHSGVVASGFNSVVDGTAAGVLADRDRLYFASIPNLWLLHPIPHSSTEDWSLQTENLATGFGVHIGVSGHDLHGLIKGPDGRIYMSFGDRGACITNREGVVIQLPDTGGVLRCEPDGRNLEVFCFGLRNPQELAFDDLGNLWTVDNDTAGADPCRVLHLVEGGDYGWRTSYQHMEGFGPWVQEELWRGGQDGILPPAGMVSQGPSGLAFFPGTGLEDRFRQTFLHADFPGGIWAFTVRPEGASYVVDRKEKILWNCWPTDVDFGPDGALYVLDWVSGWGQTLRGRIYRITSDGSAGTPGSAALVETVTRLLAEGMGARDTRELLELLGHPDRRVRLEAQWELAARGTHALDGFVQKARGPGDRLGRLHALWGLGQILRTLPTSEGAAELAALLGLLKDSDEEIRAQAALVLLGEGRLMNAEAPVRELLSDASPRVRHLAVEAFTRRFRFPGYRPGSVRTHFSRAQQAAGAVAAGASRVVGATNAALLEERLGGTITGRFPAMDLAVLLERDAGDPFLQDAVVRFLAVTGPGMGTFSSQFSGSASVEGRLAALLALRRLTNTALTNFLSDPDPQLVVAAGRAIHDVPIAEGFPALASFITKIDCPPPLHSRVLNACFRLGTQQHAQMLAGFAAREDVPDGSRLLALQALGHWERPPPLDRVNGLWRPLLTLAANATPPDAPPAGATANPLLTRAAQAQAARGLGRAAEVPVLPPDLGRSVSYGEAMALRRNPAPAQRAFLRVAGELLDPFALNEAGQPAGTREVLPLQVAVAEVAARLRVKESGAPLFEKFRAADTPPELRVAILPALGALGSPLLPEAVALALADADARVRAAALPWLDRVDADGAASLLASLIPGRPGELALAQAALAQLGRHADRNAAAAAVLLQWHPETGGRPLPGGLRLDLREALNRAGLPDAGDLGGREGELLEGGDAARGRDVFLHNATVQCLRCHVVGAEGGTLGPDLNGIGARLDRAALLESVVHPNARIAPGYETVVLTLRDGSTVAGLIRGESDDVLEVAMTDPDTGDSGIRAVRKAEVADRQSGPSAMPDGLAEALTPFEVRDLVEFLAGLK